MDAFDGNTLNGFWNVNNAKDKLTVSDGAVSIVPEQGEWFQTAENSYDIKNLVYQAAEGDWKATVDITIPGGLMLELYVEVDGNRVAEYRATATDTWTSFTEQAAVAVRLTEGTHKLRFVFDGVANFSGIKFTPSTKVDGDIDGDSDVDTNDLTALRQMIINDSGELAVCDLNSDGKIDVCDLVKLDNMLEK